MQIYTLKKNAVRGAKRAGLSADAVKPTEGGFYVEGAPDKPATKGKAKAAAKAKPAKVAKAKAKPARRVGDLPKDGTKNRKLIDMLMRESGATMAQLENALGWKAPTVRCAIQRVTKSYGLKWSHVPATDGGAKSRWEASR